MCYGYGPPLERSRFSHNLSSRRRLGISLQSSGPRFEIGGLTPLIFCSHLSGLNCCSRCLLRFELAFSGRSPGALSFFVMGCPQEDKEKSQERSGRAGKAKKAVQKATKSQRASRYAIAREAQHDAWPAREQAGADAESCAHDNKTRKKQCLALSAHPSPRGRA